ncbi:MAG: hypothetical protein KGL39_35590 [Patescibacteria group bacterium]|nr:hypothetical protein [Patescibacteria group bacterium]
MDPELATLFVICAVVLLVVGADIFLGTVFGVQYTISDQIRKLGRNWPLFVLLFGLATGLILGHFFLTPIVAGIVRIAGR